MSAGLEAAIRHFPMKNLEIEALAEQNHDFLLICDDLADAEVALGMWETSPSPVRELRTLEYQTLIDELVSEIALVLNRGASHFSNHTRGSA